MKLEVYKWKLCGWVEDRTKTILIVVGKLLLRNDRFRGKGKQLNITQEMYKGRLGKYVPGDNKEEDTGLKSGWDLICKEIFPWYEGNSVGLKKLTSSMLNMAINA